MTQLTTKEKLNNGSSSNDVAVAFATLRDADGVGLGSMLASAFSPGFVTRTGLTSSATHVEERPGMIFAVRTENGATERAIIHAGVAGAGQVLVTYSAGVPTLVFGDGANTGYQVLKLEGPKGLAANLDLAVWA